MRALEQIWWQRRESWGSRVLLAPLTVAEGLFRAAVALRGALHRGGFPPVTRVAAAVISVGNITVGGAGKTPTVMAIASSLAGAGRRVGVLSRGYRAQRSDPRLVSDGQKILLSVTQAGDEPLLLAKRLAGVAVLCGPRRAELARRAIDELGCDTLVLDDGFQHLSLARNLEVVVIDAANPTGNGHCLPRGPNREPLSALRRAHLIWLSRIEQAAPADEELAKLRRLAEQLTGRPAIESRYAPRQILDGRLDQVFGLEALRGRRVLLLSGIARPASFRRTVESLGGEIVAERIFPDHHALGSTEIEEVFAVADRRGCELVVTTEKDAVRLSQEYAGDPRLRAVRIEAQIVAGEKVLEQALAEVTKPP